ncbi:hypothetical protein PIB30_093320 [Stylosanthes scabra]|uniref:Uncharacterized protein n=1 Tax=Stylosanthes scabra TaxID=79078 RepID=A0ABU6RVS0_9FABA|nr:hypothetical protein [Stylosanthes scabra]
MTNLLPIPTIKAGGTIKPLDGTNPTTQINRKMEKGSLQSKKRSLEANLRKSSTHMRGKGRICVLRNDQSTPRHL